MRHALVALALLPACAGARPAPLRYTVLNAGRVAGGGEVEALPDGSRRAHFSFHDRGRGPDVTSTLTLGSDGAPSGGRATGHDYMGAPVDERVTLEGGELVWRSTAEEGRAPRGHAFYVPGSAPFDIDALLVRAIETAPGKRLRVLPAGEAWIDGESTLAVTLDGKPRTLRRVAIAGLGFTPETVWLDEHGDYFASITPGWFSVIAAGAEALLPTLTAEEVRLASVRAARLAADLASPPPAAGLVIQHARLFDSETRTVRDDQTIVVAGERIVAVGPRVAVPPGATVIDAHGRMLLPGLWDMHVHLGDDDGILDLAAGVTTVRDLGNELQSLAARLARFDAGTEIGPHVLRGGLIDGPGPLAAPIGTLAATPEEARAMVKLYADAGYQQIKIYSALDPKLVPVIVAEAHARGLRVSGHIPFGMNAEQAVEAGFDEVQHANMLFMNFLAGPDDDTRGPARFRIVARGAAGLDLASPAVDAFLKLLVAHKTVLDPTLVAFEPLFASDPSDPDPVLRPYRGRLPAAVERGARGGGLAVEGPRERATFRASHAAMGHLVKLAWDRGVTIVAGTDHLAGLSLARELELYVAAGIPAADVLALATLGAARVMGRDKRSGSIAAGKDADLLLVDGDPTRDIGAVRNGDLVVCRGRLYDPARLFAALGMAPRSRVTQPSASQSSTSARASAPAFSGNGR